VNDTHVIDRRLLLKLAGSLAAANALGMGVTPAGAVDNANPTANPEPVGAAPVGDAAPPALARAEGVLQPPGTYQFSGTVRLQAPLVDISGISNAHQISWSPGALSTPVATFTSFEHFAQPWQMPAIRVEGGQLDSLSVVPLTFG